MTRNAITYGSRDGVAGYGARRSAYGPLAYGARRSAYRAARSECVTGAMAVGRTADRVRGRSAGRVGRDMPLTRRCRRPRRIGRGALAGGLEFGVELRQIGGQRRHQLLHLLQQTLGWALWLWSGLWSGLWWWRLVGHGFLGHRGLLGPGPPGAGGRCRGRRLRRRTPVRGPGGPAPPEPTITGRAGHCRGLRRPVGVTEFHPTGEGGAKEVVGG